MKLAIWAVLWGGVTVSARAQEAQQKSGDAAPTTSETAVPNENPSRTTESHSKSGNGTVDTERFEVRGPDGSYMPVSDTETETVRVDATTTRTVVRTYRWDGNGERKLAQVSEAESKSTAGGDSQTVGTTSTSDVNGNFQVVSRSVADTKKISPDEQQTKSTVYVADGNGGFTASAQTEESQKTNADHTIEVKKTTRVPDGNGGWQVGEQKETTTKQDGKNRTTEERTSLTDSEGKLSEATRTVEQDTETPEGERVHKVAKYSTDGVGGPGDGRLHMDRQVTTVQKKTADGEATEEQVVEPNLANPSDGPQPTRKTKYTVLYGPSGAQQTTTTQARDANGNLSVVSVETKKSEQAAPSQGAAGASEKPQ